MLSEAAINMGIIMPSNSRIYSQIELISLVLLKTCSQVNLQKESLRSLASFNSLLRAIFTLRELN